MYRVVVIIISLTEDFNRPFMELRLDLKSLELELELKSPELELELKLIVSSGIGIGVGIENNGIGIGIELKKKWNWPQPWKQAEHLSWYSLNPPPPPPKKKKKKKKTTMQFFIKSHARGRYFSSEFFFIRHKFNSSLHVQQVHDECHNFQAAAANRHGFCFKGCTGIEAHFTDDIVCFRGVILDSLRNVSETMPRGIAIGFRSRFSQCVDYMRFNKK